GIRDRNVTGVQTCALPILLMILAITNANIGPFLSTIFPPIDAPTPEANAKGVIQYPLLAALTCNTFSTNEGMKIIEPINIPDKTPIINTTEKAGFFSK